MKHSLTSYREAAGVSLRDLAHAAGTTRQTIHRIEGWKQKPSYDLIAKLVKATGNAVRPNDFFDAAMGTPEAVSDFARCCSCASDLADDPDTMEAERQVDNQNVEVGL